MISRIALFVSGAVVLAASAGAQDPVKWTAAKVAPVAQGAVASVKLSAAIESGWHIYSLTQGPGGPMPTKIATLKDEPYTIDGKIKADDPNVKFDENFGINVETYEGGADFTVPLKVDKTVKKGAQTATITTRYQVCNASMCLPAKTEKIAVPLTVKAGK